MSASDILPALGKRGIIVAGGLHGQIKGATMNLYLYALVLILQQPP